MHHGTGDVISAQAMLIDVNSQLSLKKLSSDYKASEIGAIPAALTGLVAQVFRLREAAADDKLVPAASEPYLKGLYYLNRDIYSFDDAIAEFQEAERLDPNSALPPAGMALALVQKFERTKQKISLDQAQEFLRIAQSRSPDSARVLLAAGTLDAATGRDLRALRDFQRIQELDSHNVDALLGLASTYEILREPDQALAAFRRAKELDPEYYRPYHLMGGFYTRYGRHVEAADQFRKMVERAPGLPDSYSALGSALLELRQYSEAEAALQESLKHGETAQALNNLGVLRSWTGRYADAAAYLTRALAYEPDHYTWLMNLADNLRWSGQATSARIYYHKAQEGARLAIDLNPQSGRSRAFFAYLSCELGERDRARDEIRQSISLQPGENENLMLAIWTYECLGERGLALDRLREMTPAEAGEVCTNPDLADFCRDPRFKKEMTDKGDQ
jgi:tetratricopeptide (TPR) repeat protein